MQIRDKRVWTAADLGVDAWTNELNFATLFYAIIHDTQSN